MHSKRKLRERTSLFGCYELELRWCAVDADGGSVPEKAAKMPAKMLAFAQRPGNRYHRRVSDSRLSDLDLKSKELFVISDINACCRY